MGFLTLFHGEPDFKKVNGKESTVLPFAGTDRAGQLSHMGVGLILPDSGTGKI